MSSGTSAKAATSRRQTASDAAETKTAIVIKLLRRKNGATVADLQKATGWQAHSVRGFLSGTLKKRMRLAVISEADAMGVRRYRISKSKEKS